MHTNTMPDHPLLAEAAAVADHLLGPVDRVPIYLVTAAEAAGRFACHDGCAAFTGPCLDLALSPLLQQSGRWCGRGFAAIFDVEHIVRLPGNPAANVIGVVAHELSHYLESDPPADIRQFDERIVEEVLAACQAADFSYFAPTQAVPPWHRHGWPFIRVACHLTARLRRLRKDVTSEHVRFAGQHYGLSSAREYAKTLESELRDCRRLPIRAALSSPPPAAFLELWQRDTGVISPCT